MDLPEEIINGPGSWPDADRYMRNWHYAQIMASENLLKNSCFDDWSGDTSYANPVNNQGLCLPWFVERGGTSGATLTASLDTTNLKPPSSLAMRFNLSVAGSADSFTRLAQICDLSNARIGGLYSIAFGAHVKCSTPAKVRLSCTDGASTNYSQYHTGGGQYEKLTGIIQVAYHASNRLTFKIEVTSDFTGDVYMDRCFIYLVPTNIPTLALQSLDHRQELSHTLSLYGPSLRQSQKYKRPELTWIDVATVDVVNNTENANETVIIFPDGDVRAVVENTALTNQYRRFIITAVGTLTGTHDSGLRSGLVEAANTWYAIYAVKAKDTRDKFVLVGDTTLPLRANFATLNTAYGKDSWVYLGMIRNGDNNAVASDILAFNQSDSLVRFTNNQAGSIPGLRLANGAAVALLTYTFAAGTGAAQIPNHLQQVFWNAQCGAAATVRFQMMNATTGRIYIQMPTNSQIAQAEVLSDAVSGLRATSSAAVNTTWNISISGYLDCVLSDSSVSQLF